MKNKMKLTHSEQAVSPVIGVMLMLVATIVLAAAVSSFSGGLTSETTKAPQIAISAEAKENEYVLVSHDGGDPISLGSIAVRTFIPEGMYADMSHEIDLTDADFDGVPDAFNEAGNGNGVLEAGETLKINWADAFAPSSLGGYVAPGAGEKLTVELYDRNGDNQIAKTTTIVRP